MKKHLGHCRKRLVNATDFDHLTEDKVNRGDSNITTYVVVYYVKWDDGSYERYREKIGYTSLLVYYLFIY